MSAFEPFARAEHNRDRGAAGESAAVAWLRRQGYEIVETNYRTHPGEIDVIAREGDTLAFIEIKARSGPRFGPATAAVLPGKQRRIADAASLYLVRSGWDGPCRFDVLGLDRGEHGWEYTLVRNAFQVPARRRWVRR